MPKMPSIPTKCKFAIGSSFTVFTLGTKCCNECQSSIYCKVVRCPKCRTYSWIDDWEIYDNFAVCPRGCIVEGYECVEGSRYLCRSLANDAVLAETRSKKRACKRKRVYDVN